jgi:hypothetical protein
MARPVERPRHHRTPFEFTINVEDAFDYLDEFKDSPDYPKTGAEMGITYTPNKYQILGDRLEARFGVDMVEARKIVSMWFERNNNLRTENKMKKRIIKLTEADLEKLVKKILKEDSDMDWMGSTYNTDQHTQEEMNRVWDDLNRLNNDDVFDLMELTFNEERMSVEDFVNNLPTNFDYDYDYLVSVLKQIQNEGI